MKAVNLLPRDARRHGGTGPGLGLGTAAIFAALALGLALSVGYVILANGVTTRKDDLNRLQQQSSAAQREAVALKPYADLEQLRESLLDRVRSLAGGRYDWPTALSRIARALPSDATLTDFDGAGGADASTSASTPAAPAGTPPAAPTGPTVTLSGCTPSHDAVATVIDRLRAVQGVASVSLQDSTLKTAATNAAATPGGCPGDEQFKLTIQLSAPTPPAPAAAGAAGAAPSAATPNSTTTPAPSAAPATPTASTGASGGNS